METKMFFSPLHTSPRIPHLYTLYSKKRTHQDKIRDLKKRIQATQGRRPSIQ
jgi:ATP-dependent RNA helicase DOB1